MKFALIAALIATATAIKLGEYPNQTGNYSPRGDEYSDLHPHAQTYTWETTGGHAANNRVSDGY